MLYDPKWENRIKANPLTLGALIAWLEGQPSDQTYCYMDDGKCLAATYNATLGRGYKVPPWNWDPPSQQSFDCNLEVIAVIRPYTYGAALSRARLALHEDRWK